MRMRPPMVAAVLLGAGLGVVHAVRLATRLDRLHVRTDAAWAALDDALGRRARAAGGSAASDSGACPAAIPGWAALSAAAAAALQAGSVGREEVENELGRALALLDRSALCSDCAARLADAEQRVVIARRIYNDAVRDTVALRAHRSVRWFRLAGTAALPRYFEIVEPAPPRAVSFQEEGAGA